MLGNESCLKLLVSHQVALAFAWFFGASGHSSGIIDVLMQYRFTRWKDFLVIVRKGSTDGTCNFLSCLVGVAGYVNHIQFCLLTKSADACTRGSNSDS